MSENVIRIQPNCYIHVLDNNLNTTRLETGPKIFIRKEHEIVVFGPTQMISLAPRVYCKISNPIIKADGKPRVNSFGEVDV